MDRFALDKNTSNVAFIIYEDGVPCPAAQLEAMMDRQILIEHNLSSSFAAMDVRIGTVNGKTAIVCTPTSTTKSGFKLFFQRLWMSIPFIGSLQGEIKVDLTIDMPKGDSASGTLDLVGSGVIYWIILLIFAGLIFLICGFIVGNVKSLRLKKGVVWRFDLRFGSAKNCYNATRVGGSTQLGWGWQPRLYIPIDESRGVDDFTFFANRDGSRQRRRERRKGFGFKRKNPTVKIKGTPGDIQNLYISDGISPTARAFLDSILSGDPTDLLDADGIAIDLDDFFGYPQNAAEEIVIPEGAKEVSYSKLLRGESAMIIRVHETRNATEYYVWVYQIKT